MRRTPIVTLPVVLLLASACARPIPPQHVAPAEAMVHAAFEPTWTRAVAFFANNNVPVQTLEKASGLIASQSVDLSDTQRKAWIDCGKMSAFQAGILLANLQTHTTFNVFARPMGDSTAIRVNLSVRAERMAIGSTTRMESIECTSNGTFERGLMATLGPAA